MNAVDENCGFGADSTTIGRAREIRGLTTRAFEWICLRWGENEEIWRVLGAGNLKSNLKVRKEVKRASRIYQEYKHRFLNLRMKNRARRIKTSTSSPIIPLAMIGSVCPPVNGSWRRATWWNAEPAIHQVARICWCLVWRCWIWYIILLNRVVECKRQRDAVAKICNYLLLLSERQLPGFE